MKSIKNTISNEQLQSLEAEVLSVPVKLLTHESSVEEIELACDSLRGGHKVLGFDTETKPSFTKGRRYKVSLLQLSSPTLAVLFRLLPVMSKNQLEPIKKILRSKRIAKVGVAILDDAKSLWKDHKLLTNRMIDLRSLSKAAGIEVGSLTKLYALLYGKRISKGQRLSDWERDELTNSQIEYAALDAEAGLKIFNGLSNAFTRDMYQNLEWKSNKSSPTNSGGESAEKK